MLGQPIFPGESGVDQLVEIIKVLGTPTKEQIKAMNPNYTQYQFPQVKPNPWKNIFRLRPLPSPESMELLGSLLEYAPTHRLAAIQAMCHTFFDELRLPETRMPSGRILPPLFNFTRLGKIRIHFETLSVFIFLTL